VTDTTALAQAANLLRQHAERIADGGSPSPADTVAILRAAARTIEEHLADALPELSPESEEPEIGIYTLLMRLDEIAVDQRLTNREQDNMRAALDLLDPDQNSRATTPRHLRGDQLAQACRQVHAELDRRARVLDIRAAAGSADATGERAAGILHRAAVTALRLARTS
jgi:hypothetical protein